MKKRPRYYRRQAVLGAERLIIATDIANCVHTLECGHTVPVNRSETPNIKRRRCELCQRT